MNCSCYCRRLYIPILFIGQLEKTGHLPVLPWWQEQCRWNSSTIDLIYLINLIKRTSCSFILIFFEQFLFLPRAAWWIVVFLDRWTLKGHFPSRLLVGIKEQFCLSSPLNFTCKRIGRIYRQKQLWILPNYSLPLNNTTRNTLPTVRPIRPSSPPNTCYHSSILT